MSKRFRSQSFTLPGAVKVSPAAWQMAREFDERVRRSKSYKEWVISFSWGDSRSIRRRIDGPMEDIGPGLDIGAYDRRDVPAEVVQQRDGIAFAINIPSRIYEASAERLIDVDETAFRSWSCADAAPLNASSRPGRLVMEPDTLFSAVKLILMRDWDPIGINDEPAAQDEYDAYIQPLLRLVRDGVSSSALSDRLLRIETVEMGLPGDRERALRVADKLRELRA